MATRSDEIINNPSINPPSIFAVYLREDECKQLIAHWEKTGMFPTVIRKIRAAAATKEIK